MCARTPAIDPARVELCLQEGRERFVAEYGAIDEESRLRARVLRLPLRDPRDVTRARSDTRASCASPSPGSSERSSLELVGDAAVEDRGRRAESMFPPETMQTTRPSPARPASAAATAARAPSATMRARSRRSLTAAAVSSSEIANESATSGFACSHIFGRRLPEPAPSTNDGVKSTGTGTPPFAIAAVTGAPVSGSQT